MLPLLYPHTISEVVHYPVSTPVADYSVNDREAVRNEFDTPLDAAVIVQVSRMEEWKGQKLHLEALGRLRDLPSWVCWIIGGAQRPQEARYERELHAAAKRHGIEERVRFAGQRSDVSRILSAADIFCQPNIRSRAVRPLTGRSSPGRLTRHKQRDGWCDRDRQ